MKKIVLVLFTIFGFKIQAQPLCLSNLNISTPNYSTETLVQQANSADGLITATNQITNTARVTYQAKALILNPGFIANPSADGIFLAEVGGCILAVFPSPPANFTASTSTVCKGQNNVTYSVPLVSGVTNNWSYSGTGATISGSGNSISINFANSATSGVLSVTASNNAGTSSALTLPISVIPVIAANVNSAINQSAVLTASGCSNYFWYNSPNPLATMLFEGNPYNTQILSSNATYYVSCADAPCSGLNRTPVTVTVGAVPPFPGPISPASTNVCEGSTGVTFSIQPVAGATSYTWSYSDPGAIITGTGNQVTVNFPFGTSTGSLNVVANNAFGSSLSRSTPVIITAGPDAPTANGVSISANTSANLTADGCSIYRWYSQAVGGSTISGVQNFTTPPLAISTTYYVACNNGTACESPRTPVLVTVN